jgi:hypothetical protein
MDGLPGCRGRVGRNVAALPQGSKPIGNAFWTDVLVLFEHLR